MVEKLWKPGRRAFRYKGNQTNKSKERNEGLEENLDSGHLVTECCKRQKKTQRQRKGEKNTNRLVTKFYL